MLNGRRVRLMSAICAITSMAFVSMCVVGCATAPKNCAVSPVELEEMREDITNLQKDLKLAKDREAQLSADLAAKQADLETKRGKPPELRAELEQVKKGAGKTEKPKDAPKTTPAPAKKPAAGDTPVDNSKAPASGTKAPAPPATKPATPPSDTTKAPAPKPKPATTSPTAPKKGNP